MLFIEMETGVKLSQIISSLCLITLIIAGTPDGGSAHPVGLSTSNTMQSSLSQQSMSSHLPNTKSRPSSFAETQSVIQYTTRRPSSTSSLLKWASTNERGPSKLRETSRWSGSTDCIIGGELREFSLELGIFQRGRTDRITALLLVADQSHIASGPGAIVYRVPKGHPTNEDVLGFSRFDTISTIDPLRPIGGHPGNFFLNWKTGTIEFADGTCLETTLNILPDSRHIFFRPNSMTFLNNRSVFSPEKIRKNPRQVCREILFWLNTPDREHYNFNPSAGYSLDRELILVKLFDDRAFIPMFGAPFDALSGDFAREIQKNIQKYCSRGVYGESFYKGVFNYYISKRLADIDHYNNFDGSDLIRVKHFVREIRAYRKNISRNFSTPGGNPEEQINQLGEALERVKNSDWRMWPSERDEWRGVIQERLVSIIPEFVDDELDRIIGIADPADALSALTEFEYRQLNELLQLTDPKVETALSNQLLRAIEKSRVYIHGRATEKLRRERIALNQVLQQARFRAETAQRKYPILTTTLDSYARRLGQDGQFVGKQNSWEVVTANAEEFERPSVAVSFLKENEFLLVGGPEDFLAAHEQQVRQDIRATKPPQNNDSALRWMQEAVTLVNRFHQICELQQFSCDESEPEFNVFDTWYTWFNKSAAARDYYIDSALDGNHVSIKPLPKFFVNVCNFVPHSSRHLVVAIERGQLRRVGGWFDLNPGECIRRVDVFFSDEPAFFVHSDVPLNERKHFQYVNSIINNQLIADDDPENDRDAVRLDGSEIQAWGYTLACGSNHESLVQTPDFIQTECKTSEYEGRFAQAYTLDDSNEWYYFFETPNYLLFKFGLSITESIQRAQQQASKVAIAVQQQLRNKIDWPNQYPFSPGGKLVDFNGPLLPGIQIVSAPDRDLYGRHLGIQSGDIILEINGRSVFGILDFSQELNSHGLSRDYGVEVPVNYSIFRNGRSYQIESTYFFNPKYRNQGANQSGIAFWYGVGDAIGFGQTPEITCYGGNALRLLGNLAGAGVEGVDALINERKFDQSALNTFEYYDADECNWQKHQNRALAMQIEEETYYNSQWFAIISPSAVRMLGGKALQGYARKQFGAAVGTRLSNAMLEVVEASLWSMGTEPPGTPMNERLSRIKKLAPIAAAGGAAPLSTIGAFATSVALEQNAIGFEER